MVISQEYFFQYKDQLSRYRNSHHKDYMDGLAQDYSDSIADALDLLQSCAKPSI